MIRARTQRIAAVIGSQNQQVVILELRQERGQKAIHFFERPPITLDIREFR